MSITGQIFDISYRDTDSTIRDNHGNRWTEPECATLASALARGASLQKICIIAQRSAVGVVSKLEKLGLIAYESDGNWHLTNESPFAQSEQPLEETEMADNKIIDTRVFINGRDASSLTDRQIFTLISDLEVEIDNLSNIVNKPEKLVALIEALRTDIAALVAYVDAR